MTPTLRVGLTLRGPRGGLREVVGFEHDAAAEAQARAAGAPNPEAHRVVVYGAPSYRWRHDNEGYGHYVQGRALRRTVAADFARWSTRATVVAEGTGEVAPWA